jgi:hypothetical protein
VYSLGKTLWVLATEQSFPPEGHQPATTRQFSIADQRPHAHAATLDRLVDRATRLHPEERPTMADVAADLLAWAELTAAPVAVNVGELRTRLRGRMAGELAAEDLLEQRQEMAHAAVRRVNELFKPLNDALSDVHPRAQIDLMADRYIQNMLSTPEHSGAPDIAFKFQRLSQITSGPDYNLFSLRMGRSLELTTDGALIFRACIDVGHPTIGGSAFDWASGEHTAEVGSVQADVMLQHAIAEVAPQLESAIEAFVEKMPQPG